MENLNGDPTVQEKEETTPQEKKEIVTGVSYPVESIRESLEDIQKIFNETGTINPVPKETISTLLGKKPASLIMNFSTWKQYGIVNDLRIKGFLPTAVYKKYIDKTYPTDERNAMLTMFKSAPLYIKLIDNLDGKQLPSEEKFSNILKDAPYNVSANSADRAAKVFYQNLRELGLIGTNNTFLFNNNPSIIKPDAKVQDKDKTDPNFTTPPADKKDVLDEGVITILIPLKSGADGVKRKANLIVPDDYTDADLKRVEKFVAALKVDEVE